jgi:hypothetical protein
MSVKGLRVNQEDLRTRGDLALPLKEGHRKLACWRERMEREVSRGHIKVARSHRRPERET